MHSPLFSLPVRLFLLLLLLVGYAARSGAETASPSPTDDSAATESASAESAPAASEAAAENTDAENADAENADAENADAENADAENAGLAQLDQATQLKLQDRNGQQLSRVIDLLDEAIELGLDAGNLEFAEAMLIGALWERGEALSEAVLGRPLPDPRVDPRWVQIRDLALRDLQRAVQINPDLPEAWLMIGRLQQLPGGDQAAALPAFTNVIQSEAVEPSVRAEGYARRAVLQPTDEAQLADLGLAIETDPEKTEYRLLRARYYFARQQFDACLEDVDQALQLVPENSATHELRALVLLAQEKPEEAMKSLDQATQLSPEAVSPYLRRSELFGRQGELDKAIEQAEKAIAHSKENPVGYLVRANLYLQNDQPEQALRDAEQALRLQPGLVQGYLLQVRAYDALEQPEQALTQLEELAAAAPKRVDLLLQVGMYALQLEQLERAIGWFDRALELAPQNATLWRVRGDAKLSLGQHLSAIADYEAALPLAPEDTGVLNNLAWTLATSPLDEVRNGKRAIELATQACELTDYEQGHILSTLAAAHAEVGDFESAIQWAEKAVAHANEANADHLAQELKSYQQGQPWREIVTPAAISDTDSATTSEPSDPAPESNADDPLAE